MNTQRHPHLTCSHVRMPLHAGPAHLLEPASQEEGWEGTQGQREATARRLLGAPKRSKILRDQVPWKEAEVVPRLTTHTARVFRNAKEGERPEAQRRCVLRGGIKAVSSNNLLGGFTVFVSGSNTQFHSGNRPKQVLRVAGAATRSIFTH